MKKIREMKLIHKFFKAKKVNITNRIDVVLMVRNLHRVTNRGYIWNVAE